MHELGIVFHVVDTIKEVAEENKLSEIAEVVLEVGEVSGVIPSYLKNCWEWTVKKEPILEGSELVVETIPAVTFCEDCKQEYETVKYGKVCPHCKSENTYLIQGNEFRIKEIKAC